MKYTITPSKSRLPSIGIEIADDLNWITFKGLAFEIDVMLSSFTPYHYERSYRGNEVRLSGLNDPIWADSSLITPIINHPSCYGGILSLKFILGNIMSETDPLYHQILSDINQVSAQLDQQYKVKQAQFQNIVLSNPTVLPEEKSIESPKDVDSFKGRIVAFKTNNHFFTDSSFVSPLDNRYRFALIGEKESNWDYSGYKEVGFDLFCFTTTKDNCKYNPLTPFFFQRGGLSMRLATIDELKYLSASNQLEGGYFNLRQSDTNQIIQTELARIAPTLLLDDTDNHTAQMSSSYASSSSSQEPQSLNSQNYLPGYQSTIIGEGYTASQATAIVSQHNDGASPKLSLKGG